MATPVKDTQRTKHQRLPANLDPGAVDFIGELEELHITVQAHAGSGMFTDLRGIRSGSTRYDDKVAPCACADLLLFRFADRAYAVCSEHGLSEAGYLRRSLDKKGR